MAKKITTLKGLVKYLAKSIPDKYIIVKQDLIYGVDKKITINYRAYSNGYEFGKHGWTDEYINLQDLIDFCITKIEESKSKSE